MSVTVVLKEKTMVIVIFFTSILCVSTPFNLNKMRPFGQNSVSTNREQERRRAFLCP
jgi:hypothetical protein